MPGDAAVTRPLVETVAIASFDELKVTAELVALLTTAFSGSVWATSNSNDAGVKVTCTGRTGVGVVASPPQAATASDNTKTAAEKDLTIIRGSFATRRSKMGYSEHALRSQ